MSDTAAVLVALIAAVPPTAAVVFSTVRSRRAHSSLAEQAERIEKQLGNGGDSAIDRVVQRIDGVGAEVAFNTRRIDQLHEKLTEHLLEHKSSTQGPVATVHVSTGTPIAKED